MEKNEAETCSEKCRQDIAAKNNIEVYTNGYGYHHIGLLFPDGWHLVGLPYDPSDKDRVEADVKTLQRFAEVTA